MPPNDRPPSRRHGRSVERGDPRELPALRVLPAALSTVEGAGPPCHRCDAKCCRYIALEIDPPGKPEHYDRIRWYLLHEGIVVWVQDGGWHLEIRSRCRHLLPDRRCEIYDTRPQICRDYGLPEDEPCEFFSEGDDFELYFDSAEAFEAYARDRLARRERRLARRRQRYRERKRSGVSS